MKESPKPRFAAILPIVILLAACGGGGSGGGGGDDGGGDDGGGAFAVSVPRVFGSITFSQPLALVQHPGGRWYVAERAGRILSFDAAGNDLRVALDITDRVNSFEDESGLLGFAFHPDSASNGAVYLSYTSGNLNSRLSYFAFDSASASIDPGSEQVLASLVEFAGNHNGGHLVFQPGSNNLYWGQGDGGGAGDPQRNGQNPHSWLGAILRLDLTTPNVLAIPPDNPFADGVDGAPEVFVYGLRNPWRFDQDPVSGQLWIGDVGQDLVEEINIGVAGANYGWRCFEGTLVFDSAATCPAAGDVTMPVVTVGRGDGQSVTGGVVYRGSAIPDLAGKYVFGDFVSGNLWSVESLADGTYLRASIAETSLSPAHFATGNDGEIYVVSYLTGNIHRISL